MGIDKEQLIQIKFVHLASYSKYRIIVVYCSSNYDLLSESYFEQVDLFELLLVIGTDYDFNV